MYKILKKRYLNPAENTVEMVVEAPLVAKKCLAGQFIIFRIDEFGERIPLTIADYDRARGTVTIMFQPIGSSTAKLAALNEGDCILDFAGP
ncbi:MAG: sulfide/dihydroorotate dehydrogenase-like FAD/NAD-binding protein, partial [Clostridia bacterium]|nr:sulfide/dihydroorotate dehydrogenase-like FAD/NAD-binding protein [Clostridia bacterium]